VALVGVPLRCFVIERRLTVRPSRVVRWRSARDRRAVVSGHGAASAYLHYFFVERHLMGLTTTTQTHGRRPWWYYLPVVAGGAWPWVLYVAFAGRGRSPAHAAARRLLWT
jgi:4-amino-4-deoxy-L-arabinose transferase-like glycosyltransferase